MMSSGGVPRHAEGLRVRCGFPQTPAGSADSKAHTPGGQCHGHQRLVYGEGHRAAAPIEARPSCKVELFSQKKEISRGKSRLLLREPRHPL